jgi:hypothetical protein
MLLNLEDANESKIGRWKTKKSSRLNLKKIVRSISDRVTDQSAVRQLLHASISKLQHAFSFHGFLAGALGPVNRLEPPRKRASDDCVAA